MTTVRNSCAASTAAIVVVTLAAVIVSTKVSAHRTDEYLQAARVAVDPDSVELELDLTPGIAVAETIIADIDRDRDGLLSPREQQAYAARVVSAVELDVDGRPLQVQTAAMAFPDVDTVRRGEGTIRLRSAAILPPQSVGAHQLFFRNTHRQDLSVYLANALGPTSDRLAITAQRRDRDQRELTIDYTVRPGPAAHARAWLLVSLAVVFTMVGLLKRRLRPSEKGVRWKMGSDPLFTKNVKRGSDPIFQGPYFEKSVTGKPARERCRIK